MNSRFKKSDYIWGIRSRYGERLYPIAIAWVGDQFRRYKRAIPVLHKMVSDYAHWIFIARGHRMGTSTPSFADNSQNMLALWRRRI